MVDEDLIERMERNHEKQIEQLTADLEKANEKLHFFRTRSDEIISKDPIMKELKSFKEEYKLWSIRHSGNQGSMELTHQSIIKEIKNFRTDFVNDKASVTHELKQIKTELRKIPQPLKAFKQTLNEYHTAKPFLKYSYKWILKQIEELGA